MNKPSNTRLRLRINPRSAVNTAALISNTVLLSANAFLIGSNIAGYFRDRRQQMITQNLQMASEISSALSGITRIISDSLEAHHVQRD